jgi:SPP1 family predicted phage head-tail adaptor
MGIGQRRKIQLVEVTNAQAAEGNNTNTLQAAINTWAEVSRPSGSRSFFGFQSQLDTTRDFLIRYDFDIDTDRKWHIVYDGKVWVPSQITRVDEKNFYYRVTANARDDV